jgi:nucleoside-diphosphate-sugar epimerase
VFHKVRRTAQHTALHHHALSPQTWQALWACTQRSAAWTVAHDTSAAAADPPQHATTTTTATLPQDVEAAVAGVDVVVHVATATPTSENALNKQLMDDVNVKGTANVVAACKAHGVAALVYTSSASGGCRAGGGGVKLCGCV